MLAEPGMCLMKANRLPSQKESRCCRNMKLPDETLEELGWNAFFSEQVSVEEALHCHPVRVMAVLRGKITVAGAGSQHSIAPNIRGARPSDDHPTVGDWLLIDQVTLQPARVLRRRNLFKRR